MDGHADVVETRQALAIAAARGGLVGDERELQDAREATSKPLHRVVGGLGVGQCDRQPVPLVVGPSVAVEQLVERALDPRQRSADGTVDELDARHAVGAQLDDGDGFGLVVLGERVGKGRAAVGHPARHRLLGPVQVAERGVVHPVEQRGGGQGRPADADVALAVAHPGGCRAGDERMGHGDHAGGGRPVREVGADCGHRRGEHGLVERGIGAQVRPRELGLEVGEGIDGDVTVLVGQDDRMARPGGVGAEMHAGGGDETGTEAEAAGRIVVAADEHHRHPRRGDAPERVAEQFDRLDRGDGPVVQVAAHHHRADGLIAHHVDEEVDERGLRLELRLAVQRAAEMPVAGVEDPHAPHVRDGV